MTTRPDTVTTEIREPSSYSPPRCRLREIYARQPYTDASARGTIAD